MYKESPVGLPAEIYGLSNAALAAAIETTVWEVVSTHAHAGLVPELLPEMYECEVPEGGTAGLKIKLSDPPAGPVSVTVTRESGDSDISVSGGGTLEFTPANHGQWQTVTLSAAEDADTAHGDAMIAFGGAGIASGRVSVVEADNDATAICYDGFRSPTGAVHSVDSGYGWLRAWRTPNDSPGLKVVDGSLAYANLVTSGRRIEGGDSYRRAGRRLDVEHSFATWADEQDGDFFVARTNTPDLWVSYLVRLVNASYDGSFALDDAGSEVHDNNGILRVQPFGGQWGVSAMKGACGATSAVAVANNATYLHVLRIRFGLTNEVDLYVNPGVLGGDAPAAPDASLRFVTNMFRFYEINWKPDNNPAAGWLDEVRFGNSFANVTPTVAGVYTNKNNTSVAGRHENDMRTGYTIYHIGAISGTGTYVEATGVTNYYIGAVTPGYSAGTLVMENRDGPMLLGVPGAELGLEIENGDLLVLTNMPRPVDLANIDVTFFSSDTGEGIHWFLTSDTGFVNEFNVTNFLLYTSGTLYYDNDNGRVGVTIVPEGGVVAAAVCALLWGARRMKVRG
jgi:hypothetical protein